MTSRAVSSSSGLIYTSMSMSWHQDSSISLVSSYLWKMKNDSDETSGSSEVSKRYSLWYLLRDLYSPEKSSSQGHSHLTMYRSHHSSSISHAISSISDEHSEAITLSDEALEMDERYALHLMISDSHHVAMIMLSSMIWTTSVYMMAHEPVEPIKITRKMPTLSSSSMTHAPYRILHRDSKISANHSYL